MRYLSLLILGFLLGACCTNLLLARQQEQLHLNQAELEQRLATAKEEIAQLKESLAEESYQVVISVEPVITFKGDKPFGMEIRAATQVINQKIQEFLAPLKGQEVRRLNPALIPAMIDNRTVKIHGVEYKLKVTLILVSDSVIVHVEATQSNSGTVRGQA